MLKGISKYRIQILDVFAFFFAAFTFALPFSLYVLSVSMFGMAACIFWKDTANGIKFNHRIIQEVRTEILDWTKLLPIFFYISYALSVLWSDDYSFWSHHLRLMAPIVVLPIVFSVHSLTGKNRLHVVLLLGILSMTVQLGIVLWNYFTHFEEVNLLLLKGKTLPTPIPHIRFSLILAIYILILIYLIVEKKILGFRFEREFYFAILLFQVIGIHVLSVKSGLLSLYLGILVLSTGYLYQRRKLKHLFWIIPMLILFLIGMVWLIPSLQNKYYYLIWELGEWSRGKHVWYSDIERWESISVGWKIIMENPIMGTGLGDFKQHVIDYYQNNLQKSDWKLPHNQFIFSWASCGILSFVILSLLFYFSFIKNFFHTNKLALSISAVLWFSFLVEHTLETSIGICLFMWMLILNGELNKEGGNF